MTTVVREAPARQASLRTRPGAAGFRPDIEGLRAIAVTAVVLYHFGFLGLRGGYVGVDVFFVISGYLITRQLSHAVERRQTARQIIGSFYAGRFRRLLPAAMSTIVVTIVLTYLFAPALSRSSIYTDAAFASVYSLNYRLAHLGTQYSQVGTAASPLQHFWSLGVEEQFYFVWPALIVVAAVVFRNRWRTNMVIAVSVVSVVSLVLSYLVTRESQPWAYFSLYTRAWELGGGALLALLPAASLAGRRVWANVAAFVGVALIAWSAWRFTDTTVFPGVAALVPVVGAMLVIGGAAGVTGGPMNRVLGNSVAAFVGRISYSWYLWHWPLLVLAPFVLGRPLDGLEKVVLLAVTVLVATQSYWIVEQPARLLPMKVGRWLAAGVVSAVAVVVAATLLVSTQGSIRGSGQAVASSALTSDSDAAERQVTEQLSEAVAVRDVPSNLTPAIDKASTDVSRDQYNGCHADYTVVINPACVYGDTASTKVAVIFGDSHAEQWFAGFDAAGKAHGWKIVNWTKSGCPFGASSLFNSSLNRAYTECDTWRTATLARIVALHPARVFLSGAEDEADGQISDTNWVAQAQTTVRTLVGSDLAVSFIEDTPRAKTDVPGCLAQNLTSAQRCTYGSDGAFTRQARHDALATGLRSAGATVVDSLPWVCADGSCPVIVGNILVYRDDNHLTATYSRWLAPVIARLLVTS